MSHFNFFFAGDDEEFPEGGDAATDDGADTRQSNTPTPNASPAQSPSPIDVNSKIASSPMSEMVATSTPPPSISNELNNGTPSPSSPPNTQVTSPSSKEALDAFKITISTESEPFKVFIKEEVPDVITIPKLRLNTALASDPALQPDAKTIREICASDDKFSTDDNELLINDSDIEVKRRKERQNSVITVPVIRTSPTNQELPPRVQVFKCGPCGIRFSSLSTLEAHQTYYCSHRKDVDENNAPTKSTSVSDSGGSGEPANKSIKTGKQYACTQCSYSADKKVSLNRHMRMHQTSPTPSSTTSNGGDELLSNASQILQQQQQVLQQQVQIQVQPQQQQQQVDRYCSDCDIRFSSTKTYRAHKQHYCSSRHREE